MDKCNITRNKSITDQFESQERVLYSALVTKVNQFNKKQERILLITSKAVYNIVPLSSNPVLGMFQKMIQNQKVKRRISILVIFGVTYSNIGSEFVIHIPSEYDYRFQSANDRKEIILNLIEAYQCVQMKKMPIFFKDEFTLVAFTTTENDKKKGINRIPPQEEAVLLDQSDFQARVSNKVQSEVVFSKTETNKISIDDFDLIKVLGKGAFGKVMMCEKKDTKELYAIKSLRKEHIVDKNQVEHTRTERKLLEQINYPFLVSLEFAFQTEEKLFFVMKFMRGGELFHHLRQQRRFPESTAKFYAATIICALEYLHKMDVVYRDLKPENILMGEDGYVQITDYGLAKFLNKGQLTYSFVGTPEYLAPEIIKQAGHGLDVDWWSLGILIYEMIIGRPPYFSNNQGQLFKNIIEKEVMFPQQVEISFEAKNIILSLLRKNPYERLGHKNDGSEIKAHPWFNKFSFDDLLNKKLVPPIIPKLSNNFDVSNFDQEFTNEEAINSVVNTDQNILQQFSNDFGAVTYIPGKLE